MSRFQAPAVVGKESEIGESQQCSHEIRLFTILSSKQSRPKGFACEYQRTLQDHDVYPFSILCPPLFSKPEDIAVQDSRKPQR